MMRRWVGNRIFAVGLPLSGLFVYVLVFAAHIRSLLAQSLWNADAIFSENVANTLGTTGNGGKKVSVTITAYTWMDTLVRKLPAHQMLWLLYPSLAALATITLLVYVSWRVFDGRGALLTAMISTATAPQVLFSQVVQNFHGMAWLATALTAAYVALVVARQERPRLQSVAFFTGVIVVGVVLATDTLVVFIALIPATAAVFTLWLGDCKRNSVHAIHGAAFIFGISVVAVLTQVIMRLTNFSSGLPGRNQSSLLKLSALPHHVRLLLHGLYVLAGGGYPLGTYNEGVPAWVMRVAQLLVVLIAMTILAALWRTFAQWRRGEFSNALVVLVIFWFSSAIVLMISYVLSGVAIDEATVRYLPPLVFAVAILIPVWANKIRWREATAGILVTTLCFMNANAVRQAVDQEGFRPTETQSLPTLISFLQQQGLSRGYGNFWNAHPVSWQTDFSTNMYFVEYGKDCGYADSSVICASDHEVAQTWFTPQPNTRTFLVQDPALDKGYAAPPQSFGPSGVFRVGRYTVYIYPYDIASRFATLPTSSSS